MKTLSKFPVLILIFVLNLATAAVAEEPAEHYIEYADIIINIQKIPGSDSAAGYLLATPCDNCQPTRIEVDQRTVIHVNGNPVSLDKLGMKIDWQGAVFYLPGKPPVATRLMLN